ncbi:MAG TPA: VWA domain-containing protein [Thermoanaerobaculia bacterium]|nr:VWA domain-containing protein [Thermoanaerobaculia bacterium]
MRKSLAWLPALLALCGSASGQPAPPTGAQKSRIDAPGVSIPLDVREQFLGRTGSKTAVKFILSVNRGDLRGVGGAPHMVSFLLSGVVSDPKGANVDAFRIPADVDLGADDGKPVTISFLRPLPPGTYDIQFRLEGAAGRAVGTRAVTVAVPEMTADFRAEDAGMDAGGLPSASAVVLESENRQAAPPNAGNLVKILAPETEVPVGLLRVGCEVKPPVTRVEFWLEDKKVLVKNRPPYEVELDLGKVPKRQTLKALGYDAQGNFVDEDAWAINEKDSRLAVRLLELPKQKSAGDLVEIKVAVQSMAGGMATKLELWLDDAKVKEWSAPPYVAMVPVAQIQKATLMRATATDQDGKEFTDLKLLKGESRFMSKVEVDLVELPVSVYDAEGRLVRDLTKEDFTVTEDAVKQELTSFEFAESLPLSLGILIDGSGSMKEAMPMVHQAASEFVTRLVSKEKDQGFVIEFRERPTLLASMSHKAIDLERAIADTHANGATALYDAVIMSLYQFRATPGRKAVVCLTDGDDNHSWTDYATLRRYARSAGVPIYFIGLNISFLDRGIKGRMTELAADTGAEAFFVSKASALPEVYKKIETELRSQYFLRYLTNSQKGENQFRTIEVKLKDPRLRAKTIRGYFP